MESDWLTAVLEEYRSLRTEAIAAREAQLAVLRFGAANLAVLVAAALSLRNKETVFAAAILSLIVPGVVFFVIEIWLGEIERTIRAGNFVAAIERRLAEHFRNTDPPMAWEIWLRKGPKGQPSAPQRAAVVRASIIFLSFIILSFGSAAAGASTLNDHDTELWLFSFGTALIVMLLIARSVLVIRRLRDETSNPPGPEAIWTLADSPARPGGSSPS